MDGSDYLCKNLCVICVHIICVNTTVVNEMTYFPLRSFSLTVDQITIFLLSSSSPSTEIQIVIATFREVQKT